MDVAFRGTPSRIGGLTFEDIAEEVSEYHGTAFGGDKNGEMRTLMFNYGFVKFYQRKEHHEWNAPMTKMLHAALKDGRPDKKTGLTLQEGTPSAAQLDLYDTYKTTQDATPATTIRDMLEIVSDRAPISIDEVEPVEAIMRRFCTGGALRCAALRLAAAAPDLTRALETMHPRAPPCCAPRTIPLPTPPPTIPSPTTRRDPRARGMFPLVPTLPQGEPDGGRKTLI